MEIRAVRVKNRVDRVLGTTGTWKKLVPWRFNFFSTDLVPKYRVFWQHCESHYLWNFVSHKVFKLLHKLFNEEVWIVPHLQHYNYFTRAGQRLRWCRCMPCQTSHGRSVISLRSVYEIGRKSLQWIMRAAEKIVGVSLPSLQDIYSTRLTRKALCIAGDPTHPSHSFLSLLPSGRRLWSLQARTSRLKDSFIHQAELPPDLAPPSPLLPHVPLNSDPPTTTYIYIYIFFFRGVTIRVFVGK